MRNGGEKNSLPLKITHYLFTVNICSKERSKHGSTGNYADGNRFGVSRDLCGTGLSVDKGEEEEMTPKFPNLKAALAAKGITQIALAKRIGLCSKSLSLKMNGKVDFTLTDMQRIIKELGGGSMDYLFKKSGEE